MSCLFDLDHPLNTSDHMPVCGRLQVAFCFSVGLASSPSAFPPRSSSHFFCLPNWRKCEPSMVGQYREAVRSSLPEIPDHWTFDAIDIFVKDLTTSLISSASSCFPAVQFHKFQRPFWDKSLRAAHSKSKQAYRVWCGLGRPSASNDPSRLAYKRLKCLFRRQLLGSSGISIASVLSKILESVLEKFFYLFFMTRCIVSRVAFGRDLARHIPHLPFFSG